MRQAPSQRPIACQSEARHRPGPPRRVTATGCSLWVMIELSLVDAAGLEDDRKHLDAIRLPLTQVRTLQDVPERVAMQLTATAHEQCSRGSRTLPGQPAIACTSSTAPWSVRWTTNSPTGRFGGGISSRSSRGTI